MNAQEVWNHTEEFLKSPYGGDSQVLVEFSQGKYDELIDAVPELAGHLAERKQMVTEGIEFIAMIGLLKLVTGTEVEVVVMELPKGPLQ